MASDLDRPIKAEEDRTKIKDPVHVAQLRQIGEAAPR